MAMGRETSVYEPERGSNKPNIIIPFVICPWLVHFLLTFRRCSEFSGTDTMVDFGASASRWWRRPMNDCANSGAILSTRDSNSFKHNAYVQFVFINDLVRVVAIKGISAILSRSERRYIFPLRPPLMLWTQPRPHPPTGRANLRHRIVVSLVLHFPAPQLKLKNVFCSLYSLNLPRLCLNQSAVT